MSLLTERSREASARICCAKRNCRLACQERPSPWGRASVRGRPSSSSMTQWKGLLLLHVE